MNKNIHFQEWTIYDLGRSSKPNDNDYLKVKLFYECHNNEEEDETESKWHDSMRIKSKLFILQLHSMFYLCLVCLLPK